MQELGVVNEGCFSSGRESSDKQRQNDTDNNFP